MTGSKGPGGYVMDPNVETLTLQLASTAARNTASSILGRIAVIKKTRKENETISELEEIVNDLLSDKNELSLIGQAYEQVLVAQKISENDIEYIPLSSFRCFGNLLNRRQSTKARILLKRNE
jgi:hypothetical protein